MLLGKLRPGNLVLLQKHYFDKSYSLETREIGYNDSEANYTKVYDCLENENKKHLHEIEACPSVITETGVQTF